MAHIENPAGEEGGKAAELNERIAQVVEDVRAIIDDAKAAGVYSDKASISKLNLIAQGAQDVHAAWMEQSGQEEPMEKDNYNPAKLLEIVGGKDMGPFSGPMEPQNPIKNPNPFGGRVVNMESPNYGLPKRKSY